MDGEVTLRGLHHVIRTAFGWTDAHLHEFVIEGQTYAMLDNENVLDTIEKISRIPQDDRKGKLQRLVYPGQIFTYGYDFGDGWTHVIKVEKIEPRSEKWGMRTSLMASAQVHQRMSMVSLDMRHSWMRS